MVLANFYRDNSIGNYIEMFLDKCRSKSEDTYSTYYNGLQLMSKNIFKTDLLNLTKEDIENLKYDIINDYKFELAQKNKNTTVNNRISTIKSFIEYLTARKVIDYNIAELNFVELLNDDSEITEMIPEETLYQYAEYFENNEKRKPLEKKWATLFLLETGNRTQEILNIKKNQFIKDNDSYIIKSKGSNRGKGNAEYIERIGVEIYEELMKLNPESDKVFSITYGQLCDSFNRANLHFGNLDIKYTPHSIKHLAVTLEYNYTGDILKAQRKGKHSSVETTRRYLRVSETVDVGAYSRRLNMDDDLYLKSEKEDLVNVISQLPKDVQALINQKLQKLKE